MERACNIVSGVFTAVECVGFLTAALKDSRYVNKLVQVADIAGDVNTNAIAKLIKNFLKNIPAKNIVAKSADEVNEWWRVVQHYDNPPYTPGKTVLEFELGQPTKFVRVYDDVNSYMKGQWFMRAEEIAGLTPEQIQNKFSLPTTPKFIVDLELPAGTRIRVGETNPLFGFSGGGIQFDAMGQMLEGWSNARSIV